MRETSSFDDTTTVDDMRLRVYRSLFLSEGRLSLVSGPWVRLSVTSWFRTSVGTLTENSNAVGSLCRLTSEHSQRTGFLGRFDVGLRTECLRHSTIYNDLLIKQCVAIHLLCYILLLYEVFSKIPVSSVRSFKILFRVSLFGFIVV